VISEKSVFSVVLS